MEIRVDWGVFMAHSLAAAAAAAPSRVTSNQIVQVRTRDDATPVANRDSMAASASLADPEETSISS